MISRLRTFACDNYQFHFEVLLPNIRRVLASAMSLAPQRPVTLFLALSLIGFSVKASGQGKKLTTREAKHYIGQQATVCGRVVGWRQTTAQGNPTFLDFSKPYPNQSFSAIIWARNLGRFNKPEDTYQNRKVCVTGHIGSDRGHPEIIISDPTQLILDVERAQR